MSGPPAPLRPFWFGLGLAALVIVSLCLWVASREWFTRDDFAFLAYVQSTDPWSWRQVFLPLEERFWPFYRPLSMETYFWVGHRLFGLNAFGFFTLSLGLHFLSAGLVFRLARQLGFDTRVALVTALLAVSRHGTLAEIFYGSVFMYVGEVFFSLLSITFFLDHLRTRRVAAQVVSCLGLVLALGCNEVAVTIPALLVWLGWGSGRASLARGGWRRLLGAALPQAILVALYLVFRFHWIAPAESPALYSPSLGAHVPFNAARLLFFVLGNASTLLVAVALGVALVVAVAARRDPRVAGWLLRTALATAGWTATLLAPFALLPFAQARWAMPLAAPVCLFFGALLEAFWRAWAPRRERVVEVALLCLVLVSFPYAALRARASDPLGAHPRAILEWIETQQPRPSPRAILVLLFGVPGLASAEDAEHFRYLAYGGGVLNAADPQTRRVMRFVDLSRRPGRSAMRPDSVYLLLRPDLDLERAAPALLDRELPRRFEPAR
jgi:hypothetical protein